MVCSVCLTCGARRLAHRIDKREAFGSLQVTASASGRLQPCQPHPPHRRVSPMPACSLPLSCHGHPHAYGTRARAGQQVGGRVTRAVRLV